MSSTLLLPSRRFKKKAKGINIREASLPNALIDATRSIDQLTDSTISKKSNTGHTSIGLKVMSCLRTASTDNNTKNITEMLLYPFPMGIVIATSDNKKTKSFLPGDRPILFSKAFLEKL